METSEMSLSNLVRHFSPAWYASVMGTGGLANVLFLLGSRMPFLKPIAFGLLWLNIALFVVLIFPWIARWFLHFDKLVEDLKQPIMSNFFVTMPVGGLILGTNLFIIGKGHFSMPFIVGSEVVLWLFTVLLALILGAFVMYNMLSIESIGPEQMNFAWFITPVASIVIPLLGNILVGVFVNKNLNTANLINLVDIIFFGIGFMLFILLGSILLNRFIAHKMPHAMATPTFWIILGPIGVGTLSLMGIADSSKLLGLISSTDALKMLSLVLWGFGIWAFALTILITIKYIKEGGIPFSLSWWAFIFPLAAYTLSSFNVFMYTKVGLIYWYTVILAVLLVTLWISTFIRTLLGTLSGKLLIPPVQKKN